MSSVSFSAARFANWTAVVALAVAVLFTTVPASAGSAGESIGRVNGLLGQDEPLDRSERVELAKSMLAVVRDYAANFPTLSPDETKYVERELENAKGQRMDELINSEEYLIWEQRGVLTLLRKNLGSLSSGNLKRDMEVRYWALVAYRLIGTLNDNHVRLRNMGAIDQSGLNYLFAWSHSWAKDVLLKTIVETRD